ncbi:srg family chemoreceptor domain-containing protein [Ditylenchus destructor]|uniref:Serpentine receptor class gamma n=1 Tax=Ditylenchus destructor TaxID=166010 RepID=A0AAD4MR52_9BILA|nr:srg family chemoreceptor domain-containing protein [Ditylenchus destructor]
MLIFIFSRIVTKKAYYRQGFYVLYCAVSLVDLYYVAITYALFRIGYLFGLFVDAYRGWDLGAKWVYGSTSYCAWFQVCAHTTIAFNRFTVFYFNQSHDKIWSGKWLVLIIITLFISPVFGMAYSFGAPVTYIFNADELVVVTYYDKKINQIGKTVGFCYYFPLTIIGFTLNICSLVRYRRYMGDNSVPSGQVKQDLRLLIHTIFMLMAQILRTIYYVISFIGVLLLPENVSSNLLGFMQANIFLFSDAYSLLGSVFLFILSGLWIATSIFFPSLYNIYMRPMLLSTQTFSGGDGRRLEIDTNSWLLSHAYAVLYYGVGAIAVGVVGWEMSRSQIGIIPTSLSTGKVETNGIDSCLREKDPWSPQIMKFVRPSEEGPHFPDTCKPKTEITQLVESSNGKLMQLSIRPEYINEYECRYRCSYPKNDWSYLAGNWTTLSPNVSIQPPCDVFEVEGKRKGNGTDLYRDLYHQIYREPTNITQKAKGFGVHILVLDSTSHSNFLRSAPKLTQLLLEEYGAIPFPHLNKIGLNSWPNGFAILMGKQSEDMPASPINNKTIKGDAGYEFDTICHVPLDNQTSSIVYQFRELGYKTMWAEDWAYHTFNYPDCTGFKKQPADHYFKPFTLRIDNLVRKDRGHHFLSYKEDHCVETYQVLLQNLQSFLHVYDDIDQKFSLTWMTNLNHNNFNAFHHADVPIYKTFRQLKPKLENSFLFVMSDHGIRFGAHRNTKIGAMEDNNPALFIALPKALRSNAKLKEIMFENARHLVSHHDVYATLLSIAKNGHEWDGSDWESEWPKSEQLGKLPNMHGSSLFHYPMKQPRDCASLRIPFDYCQCPGKYIDVTEEEDLKLRLALKSLEKLNADINARGFSDKCEKLELDKNVKIALMEFMDTNYLKKTANTSVRHFKIVFQATPGGGLFSIKIRKLVNGNVEFTADQFERLNKYGDQSKCAQQDAIVKPLCFCKSL